MPVSNRSKWKTGVYLIRNKVNEKVYIGSAARRKGVQDRIAAHKRLLNKGKSHNQYLQRAWDKYGEDCFEFLTVLTCSPTDCVRLEQIFIDQYKASDPKYGYNICPIAGNTLGSKRTQEQVEKVAARLRGRKLSEEHKTNMSKATKGIPKPRTPEHQKKITAALIGRNLSEEHKAKLALAGAGRIMAPESIEKTAAAHRGMKRSEEARARMSLVRQLRSAEYKAAGIEEPHKGIKRSEETKEKLSVARINYGRKRRGL